jgi:hypothetical protein
MEGGETSDGFHPNDTGNLRIATLVTGPMTIRSA